MKGTVSCSCAALEDQTFWIKPWDHILLGSLKTKLSFTVSVSGEKAPIQMLNTAITVCLNFEVNYTCILMTWGWGGGHQACDIFRGRAPVSSEEPNTPTEQTFGWFGPV